MHKNSNIYQLTTFVVLLFALTMSVTNPQHVALAQTTAPTPLPLPATDLLIVVAGGHGADLYTADGTFIARVNAGARLIADRQSRDGQWLSVATEEGDSGWAMRQTLLVFDRITLPTSDVTINPAPPTPPTSVAAVTMTETTSETVEIAAPEALAAAATEATTGTNTIDSAEDTAIATTIQARVQTDNARLNIRSGPSTAYPVIAKAASGEALSVVARNADQSWLYVSRTDSTEPIGWVATQYVAVTEPLTDLAIAQPSTTAPVQSANVASPSQAVAPPAGLQGKIVFSERNGGAIHLYDVSSGQLIPLTVGLDPAISPDGTQVVFTRGGGESGIYLINVDGSNERKIFSERELLRSPKWSPDGQWIVFSRGDEFNKCYLDKDTGECLRSTPFFTDGLATGKDHIRKLARIDRNGKNYRDLAVVEDAVTPDWGSDGIVYQSGSGLQITQDTPEDQNRLLYFEILRQYHQDPDWQPGPVGTSGRIVFQQRQGTHYEIFVINPDGSGLSALTRPVTTLVDQLPSNVSPAWSPDGQFIVFVSNRTDNNEAGPWRLWVMNADGTNQRPLPINVPIFYDYASEQMVDWGP